MSAEQPTNTETRLEVWDLSVCEGLEDPPTFDEEGVESEWDIQHALELYAEADTDGQCDGTYEGGSDFLVRLNGGRLEMERGCRDGAHLHGGQGRGKRIRTMNIDTLRKLCEHALSEGDETVPLHSQSGV